MSVVFILQHPKHNVNNFFQKMVLMTLYLVEMEN